MRVSFKTKQVTKNTLNTALKAFAEAANSNVLASGNKIELHESEDIFEKHGSGTRYEYTLDVTIEWERVKVN